jgi:hypothetical protein
MSVQKQVEIYTSQCATKKLQSIATFSCHFIHFILIEIYQIPVLNQLLSDWPNVIASDQGSIIHRT